MEGFSQCCLCKELKTSLQYLVISMSVRGQTVGRMSKLTTHIGKRETQSRRFPFKISLRTKARTADSYQNLLQIELKLNFAHQTSSHAHAHENLCLLASSWRHYLHNMHRIIQTCTQETSASLGSCRMCALSERQGGARERTGDSNTPTTSLS